MTPKTRFLKVKMRQRRDRKKQKPVIDLVPVELAGQVIHVTSADRPAVQILNQFFKQPATAIIAMLGLTAFATMLDVLKRRRR